MSCRKPAIGTNMDMYLEKDVKKAALAANTSSSPGVCFVCGCPSSATFLLRTRAPASGSSPVPHFPFLEQHEPPLGCDVPRTNGSGTVLACYLCYSFLLAQWDSHERNNTPHSTRLYWLKRVDQGPYSSGDAQTPSRHHSGGDERPFEASPPAKIQDRAIPLGFHLNLPFILPLKMSLKFFYFSFSQCNWTLATLRSVPGVNLKELANRLKRLWALLIRK